jgi:hypothetical protein
MRKLISFSAVLALMAAIALPALAAGPATTTTTTPNPVSHPHWFAGSVSSVGSDSLSVGVLWTGPKDGSLNGQTVSPTVTSATQIVSGKDQSPASLSDIQPGDLVGVQATAQAGDLTTLTATKIRIYCNCHWVSGTISALGTNSITLTVAKTGPYDTVLAGQSVTIGVNGSTSFIRGRDKSPIAFSDLALNEGVGIIFSANGFFKAPGFDPSTAVFTAKQVHVWGHRQVPPLASDAAAAAGTAA